MGASRSHIAQEGRGRFGSIVFPVLALKGDDPDMPEDCASTIERRSSGLACRNFRSISAPLARS